MWSEKANTASYQSRSSSDVDPPTFCWAPALDAALFVYRLPWCTSPLMPIGGGAIACNTRLETLISRLHSISSSLQHLCHFQRIRFTNSSCFLVPRRKKHQLDILTLDSPAERHNCAPSIHNVRKDVKKRFLSFFPLNKLLIKKRLYWMKGGKKVIPEKAFSGKSEKIHSEGKKISET